MAIAITSADFVNSALKDHGVTVVRTPITQTTDNLTGAKIRTSGTPVNISIVFENPNQVFDLLEQGEQEGSESGDTEVRAFVKGDVTVNHEDTITWNTLVFRVENVSTRYFGSNAIFKTIKLDLITP